MKEHVVLVLTLLIQTTRGGGVYYSAESCSTLEPMFPEPEVKGKEVLAIPIESPGSEPSPPKNIMRVTFEPATFKPEQPIILTISSTEEEFLNAFVRTVCDSCSHKYDRIGEFVRHDTKLEFYDCYGNDASAAEALSYENKDLFTMKWVPDPDMTERFHFEGSLMLNGTYWYSGYRSDTFSFIQSTTPGTSASGTMRTEAVLMCIALTTQIFK